MNGVWVKVWTSSKRCYEDGLRTSPQYVYLKVLWTSSALTLWTSWKRCLQDAMGTKCVPTGMLVLAHTHNVSGISIQFIMETNIHAEIAQSFYQNNTLLFDIAGAVYQSPARPQRSLWTPPIFYVCGLITKAEPTPNLRYMSGSP